MCAPISLASCSHTPTTPEGRAIAALACARLSEIELMQAIHRINCGTADPDRLVRVYCTITTTTTKESRDE